MQNFSRPAKYSIPHFQALAFLKKLNIKDSDADSSMDKVSGGWTTPQRQSVTHAHHGGDAGEAGGSGVTFRPGHQHQPGQHDDGRLV